MPESLPLTVVVLTKNEAGRIRDCLDSVPFADEILVVDDESSDDTVAIARNQSPRVRVVHRKMDLEGRHRNWAAAQARNDWILSIDADERVTPELAEELQTLFRGTPEKAVYAIPRRNYIGRRWLKHGGWYPSAQVKLYKRSAFRWEETTVHCRAISDQPSGALTGDILHYSYRDIGDFIGKLNRQTTLETRKWLTDGRKMSFGKGMQRTIDRFFRAYVGKKGRKDGWIGFVAAVLGGLYQFVSYAKYWEATQRTETVPAGDAVSRPAAEPPGRRRPTLAVVMMVKNEAARLAHCLEQVQGWADEIVIVDDESSDDSVAIAKRFTPKVFVHPSRDNHDQQWNIGSDRAESEWILHIDADEIVTPALRDAIDEALRTNDGRVRAYDLIRLNFFLGHPMRRGGWRHRHRILFRRKNARCVGQGIHVRLQVDGEVAPLEAEIEHHPFQSFAQFIDRQNHYSNVEAAVLFREKGRLPWQVVRGQMVFKPIHRFWKSFIKQGGFREGRIGFLFAGLTAFFHHALWAKYWEIAENHDAVS